MSGNQGELLASWLGAATRDADGNVDAFKSLTVPAKASTVCFRRKPRKLPSLSPPELPDTALAVTGAAAAQDTPECARSRALGPSSTAITASSRISVTPDAPGSDVSTARALAGSLEAVVRPMQLSPAPSTAANTRSSSQTCHMRIREGWIPVPESFYTSMAGAVDPDAWFREKGINPYATVGLTLDTAHASPPPPRKATAAAARSSSVSASSTVPRAGAAGQRTRQTLLPAVPVHALETSGSATGASSKRWRSISTGCSTCGMPQHLLDGDAGHTGRCAAMAAKPPPPAGTILARLPRLVCKGDLVVCSVRVASSPTAHVARAAWALQTMAEFMGVRVAASPQSVLAPASSSSALSSSAPTSASGSSPSSTSGSALAAAAGTHSGPGPGFRADERLLTVLLCLGPRSCSSAAGSQLCLLGVATAEPISSAVRRAAGEINLDTAVAVPAARVGVRQIWAHPQARRRGVGRLLLEGLQLAGVCSPAALAEVAFSSPTIAGAALARAVCGREDIAVYG